MDKLYEHIVSDDGVKDLLEANWKQAAVAGLIGASMLANPAMAKDMARDHRTISRQVVEDERINIEKLLFALKQVESSGGKDTGTRYEPGVEKQLRKRYSILSNNVKEAIDKYGYKAMATSYGPYQILASTAYDIGYKGDIEDLKTEEGSKNIVGKFINKLISSSRTKTLKDVISAYNAGLGGIGNNPNYVDKVLRYYK